MPSPLVRDRIRFGTMLAVAAAISGCLGTAAPRFPPEVAATIRQESMRRMESAELVVYYPAPRRFEAERFIGQVSRCVRELRHRLRIDNSLEDRKPFVVLSGAPLDNAFVMSPAMGFETASVVTGHSTWDPVLELSLAPDPAAFGCHEMVHWVHVMQMAGFWGWINRAFGDIATPQLGLDPWVFEGLATYYESRLRPGTGRMISPLWEGAFHAGVAGRRLNGGDLSFAGRKFVHGNHYLVGSRFIAFLAKRYGEEKLWRLVETQGRAFWVPLWVSLRFWQVYDKNLSTLLDEFADEVAARYPVRHRPPQQRSLQALGYAVRMAVGRDGTTAIVAADFDQPLRLTVLGADGRQRARRPLQEVLLPRTLVDPDVHGITGLSVTADGREVYFALADQGVTFRRVRLVRYRVDSDQLTVVAEDLGGPGGAITDDGSAFLFARASGDRHELAEWDLRRGRSHTVVRAGSGVFLGSPRPSPDGRSLVATVMDRDRPRLAIFDRATGKALGTEIDTGQPVADPWFLSDGRVVFAGASDRRFQLFVHDPSSGYTRVVTRAPYAAIAPRPTVDGKLRFLNREGWGWTLDETALPAMTPPATSPPAPTPPAAVFEAPPAPLFEHQAVQLQADTTEVAPAEAPAEAETAAPAPPAPAPPPPEPPPGPRIAPPVRIESDGPYRFYERLFTPQLHGLALTAFPDSDRSALGIALAGGDRLSLHRWALNLYYGGGAPDEGKDHVFSGSVGYANSQLAPLIMLVQASHFSWCDRPPGVSMGPHPLDFVERDAEMTALFPFLTHAVGLSLHVSDRRRRGYAAGFTGPDYYYYAPQDWRLGGGTAFLMLDAAEATPITGRRRSLWLQLDSSIYPAALGSQRYTFADPRAALVARTPVPPFDRLLFSLSTRARALAFAPRGEDFLEVGGIDDFSAIWEDSSAARPLEPLGGTRSLPIRFREPLRGYEDHLLLIDRVLMAEVSLRYPLIVDRGAASTLVLLPSFFLRQVDLEVFADSAWDLRGSLASSLHAAAGASVTARMLLGIVPISLRYQAARRLHDDRAWTQVVGIGAF